MTGRARASTGIERAILKIEGRFCQVEHVVALDVPGSVTRRHDALFAGDFSDAFFLQAFNGNACDQKRGGLVEASAIKNCPWRWLQRRQLQAGIDVRLALAGLLGHHVGRVAVLAHQHFEPFGLFERMQVLALQVLDDLDFQRFGVAQVAHDRRHGGFAGQLGCAEAAFAGDHFKEGNAGVDMGRAQQDRLCHAMLGDAGGQVGQRRVIKDLARVGFGGGDALHRRIDKRCLVVAGGVVDHLGFDGRCLLGAGDAHAGQLWYYEGAHMWLLVVGGYGPVSV